MCVCLGGGGGGGGYKFYENLIIRCGCGWNKRSGVGWVNAYVYLFQFGFT